MIMATTPPSQPLTQTPPTPLHGARYDSYRPYSTRKSTRHSKHWIERDAQTPPPQSFKSDSGSASVSDPRTGSAEVRTRHTFSPPPSTQNSPQEKLSQSGRWLRSTTSSDMSRTIFTSLEPSSDSNKALAHQLTTTNVSANMLPTPAKTPRRKPIPAPALASTARILFPVRTETVEEAMPALRKRGRKRRNVGFSLDGSGEDDEGNIQIFTDSKEKVPELDLSEDNPFYENPLRGGSPRPPTRPRVSSRKKAGGAIDTHKEMEAFKRGEGMLYVFRGRKTFKKFADDEESDTNWNNDDLNADSSPRLRPFTRSSIKPRLLFPTAAQRKERGLPINEDEEAITDIEDLPPLPNDSEMTDLAETEEEAVTTPVNQSFPAPATPPTTGHATRAATKKAELGFSSPIEPETVDVPEPVPRRRAKKLSPFDGWQRIKAPAAVPLKGRKREGDGLEKEMGAGGFKRIKGRGA